MDKYLRIYAERFGDGFPMIPLASGRTDEEIIEIIKECLEKGKDVYELEYVQDSVDLFY